MTFKEKNGSSFYAIKQRIIQRHPSLTFRPHLLKATLKKGVDTGKLKRRKNSYKLTVLGDRS